METLLQYRIPVWHPLLVHFPIVLVIAACVVSIVWVATNRRPLLLVALGLQLAGLLGGLFAFYSGDVMLEQSEGVQIVDELAGLHESFALASLWVVGFCATMMAAATWLTDRDMTRVGTALWVRLLIFLLSLAAAALIWTTGHIGGTMVWGVPA